MAVKSRMKRRITQFIKKDLERKIVLLSGPRQAGKTTLAKSLSDNYAYLNYDFAEDRISISKMLWPKDVEIVILDELHKMPNWKRWLKGVYDVLAPSKNSPSIIVTGSARLDTAKKMGDSLAGRHFNYRLNPLCMKELDENVHNPLLSLMKFSGFPEPFIERDLDFYKKWQISHLDIILRQDLLDLEQVTKINQIETLVELLRHKVGSPCSYTSLAEDLQVAHTTVKRWLTILENLFIIFKVSPYHRNVVRALSKMPKYYFYDIGRVPDQKGARFENLVALNLASEIDFLRDTKGRKLSLNYLRDKDGHEIDFVIVEEGNLHMAVESKWSETSPDSSFRSFFEDGKLKARKYIQIVAEATATKEFDFGLRIEPAEKWLKSFIL